MNGYIQSVVSYIDKTLGLAVELTPWDGAQKLPLLLTDRYAFYTFKIYDYDCLLFISEANDETPALITKRIKLLMKYWNGGIIYSRTGITSTERNRLIKAKVPFIIPNKQLYLPFLAIDMKEIFPEERKKGDKLSPSAQILILGKLYQKSWIEESPSKIADKVSMTRMSIGRAFTELEQHDIASIEKIGREKNLVFHLSGEPLWQSVKDLMRSPVTSCDVVPFKPKANMVLSGETALVKYSMLQEPNKITFAIWNRERNRYQEKPNNELDNGNDFIIQKWSYNPLIFTSEGTADPLSVFLQFRDSEDERIEMALDELVKDIKW